MTDINELIHGMAWSHGQYLSVRDIQNRTSSTDCKLSNKIEIWFIIGNDSQSIDILDVQLIK